MERPCSYVNNLPGYIFQQKIIILKNSNQGLWKNYKEQGMYTTGGAWWATVHDITKASEKT